MISHNPASAFYFGNSVNILKQQNHTQRSARLWQNNCHVQFSTAKATDTLLFRGPTQEKEAFKISQPPKGYSVNSASTSEIAEMVDFIEKTFAKTEDRSIYEASCRHALDQGGYSYIIRDITIPGKPIIGTALLNPNGYIFLTAVR